MKATESVAMIRIALLDDYQNVARSMAPWDSLGPGVEIEVFTQYISGQHQVAEALRDFHVVMALRERTRFPRALLERLPELRLLATAGRGNAAIDLDAATELGIPVCATGGGGVSTMELAWGLIIAVMRRLTYEHRRMGGGYWQNTVGRSLHGKTLGLIGLGNIGGRMTSVAQAFGMNLLAWSANLTDERAAECGAERVSLDDLLARADVVSIHMKLGARTTGLLKARELGLMKPTAYLVNTSRGPIVDEIALVDALKRKTIAGAALDVYDAEPLPPDHPLRTLDNVVLSPHLGYVTEETYRVFYGDTCENIRAWMEGNPTRVLNEDVLEHRRPVPD